MAPRAQSTSNNSTAERACSKSSLAGLNTPVARHSHGGSAARVHSPEEGEHRLPRNFRYSFRVIPANVRCRSLTRTRTSSPPSPRSPQLTLRSHIARCFRYARREDYIYGAGMGAIAPAFMLVTERYAPSFSGKGAFGPVFRLSCGMGLVAATFLVWERSSCTSDRKRRLVES